MNRKTELRSCLRKAGVLLVLAAMLTALPADALAADAEGGAETATAAQHYTIPEDALEAPMPVYDNYGAAPVDEARLLKLQPAPVLEDTVLPIPERNAR